MPLSKIFHVFKIGTITVLASDALPTFQLTIRPLFPSRCTAYESTFEIQVPSKEGLRLEQSTVSLCRDASREKCCTALSINGRMDGICRRMTAKSTLRTLY